MVAAVGFYVYGIAAAIIGTVNSTKESPAEYPQFLSTTIGSIQALLLTNLGALLGISLTSPNSSVARSLRLSGSADALIKSVVSPMELSEKIQMFALIIYILSLIACLVTWIAKNFSDDSTLVVSVISECSKMFTAVILAYVTAVFARKATTAS